MPNPLTTPLTLTTQQRDVYHLLGLGWTNTATGAKLGLSLRVVGRTIAQAKAQNDLPTTAALLYRLGLEDGARCAKGDGA